MNWQIHWFTESLNKKTNIITKTNENPIISQHLCIKECDPQNEDLAPTQASGCCVSSLRQSLCRLCNQCCCVCAGPTSEPIRPNHEPCADLTDLNGYPVITYVDQHNSLGHDLTHGLAHDLTHDLSDGSTPVPTMPFHDFEANCIDTFGPYSCDSNKTNANNRMWVKQQNILCDQTMQMFEWPIWEGIKVLIYLWVIVWQIFLIWKLIFEKQFTFWDR